MFVQNVGFLGAPIEHGYYGWIPVERGQDTVFEWGFIPYETPIVDPYAGAGMGDNYMAPTAPVLKPLPDFIDDSWSVHYEPITVPGSGEQAGPNEWLPVYTKTDAQAETIVNFGTLPSSPEQQTAAPALQPADYQPIPVVQNVQTSVPAPVSPAQIVQTGPNASNPQPVPNSPTNPDVTQPATGSPNTTGAIALPVYDYASPSDVPLPGQPSAQQPASTGIGFLLALAALAFSG